MNNKTVIFSNYTIGTDALDALADICNTYGNKILVIGGNNGIKSIKEKLMLAIENTNLEIVDFLWYGGECSYENMNKLTNTAQDLGAEIILAIGGGKALDTAKGVGENLKLPVMTVPTIASTCAAITSLSVIYDESGSFKSFYFFHKPPVHCFIDSEVIAKAPSKYLRAGIGDTVAKHYECTFASRNDELNHTSSMAIEISKLCAEPLIKYGEKALKYVNENICSFEVEQVILNNIISTGMVSMLIDENYNGAVAHSLCYGLTLIDHVEKNFLHGDIVAYGVLVQLALDNNISDLKILYKFFKNIGIPTSLKDMDVKNEFSTLEKTIEKTLKGPDMANIPYEVTKDMLFNAIDTVEKFKFN